MRFRAHLASVLLAAFLAIPGTTIQSLPILRGARVEVVAGDVLRKVRTCLAVINRFIADGDLDALWPSLDRFGHGLDPWPSSSASHRDLVALAFRGTFRQMHLSLGSISLSDDLYATQIDMSDGLATLPPWLNVGNAPVPVAIDTLLALDESGLLVGRSPLIPASPLVFAPPDPETPFALSGPSQLVAARLTLIPADHGGRSIAIAGPAMIVLENGSLRVEGVGRRFTPGASLTDWRHLQAGKPETIAPGDVIYLPSGSAVLSTSSSSFADLIYAAVLPMRPADDSEIEGGRVTHATLTGTILAANAPSTVWFGSIDWVQQATGIEHAGNAVLSLAWIVLAPGTSASVLPDSGISLAIALPTAEGQATRLVDAMQLANSTTRTQIALVFHADTR